MVEVYFSNLCNMSCIYCGPSLSSTWEHEARKFKLVPDSQLDSILLNDEKYKLILEKFWQWLAVNATNITKYNILGGEPFYQPELETNINFFETHPCPKLRMTIFSNLKVNHEKFKKILTQLDGLVSKGHLCSVEITCSLDAWGPQQEYVRTGLDLVQWERNFDTVVYEGSWRSTSFLEVRRFGAKLQLPRIVPHHVDVVVGKAVGGLGSDLQSDCYLGPSGPLQLHDDGVQNCIERLYRANHVDLDRAVEAPWPDRFCGLPWRHRISRPRWCRGRRFSWHRPQPRANRLRRGVGRDLRCCLRSPNQ